MSIEWDKLGFEFRPVNANIRHTYRNGRWEDGRLCQDYEMTLSVAANCLHYGQAVFEGIKAFGLKDGKVKVFRPEQNAARLNSSLRHLLMPEIPERMFMDAVAAVIKANLEFVPPYGTGGALYLRPVVVGTSPQIGISASLEYEFILMAVPVGPYYRGGIKPVSAYVPDYDRAAPRGTGHIKSAGNYAASLYPTKLAKEKGCQVALFLDAKTHEYIEEFGTSNFMAITADGKYVTPDSPSILPSVTNLSLMQLAQDIGMKVERRRVHKCELHHFTEVGACGTAVVITPVTRIICGDEEFHYGNEIGPTMKKLYDRLTGIQFGDYPDKHGWMREV